MTVVSWLALPCYWSCFASSGGRHSRSGSNCAELAAVVLTDCTPHGCICQWILCTCLSWVGVPRRSILGLLLFFFFTADVFDIVRRHAVSLHIFTDDRQSLYNSVEDTIRQFADCLCKVDAWMWASQRCSWYGLVYSSCWKSQLDRYPNVVSYYTSTVHCALSATKHGCQIVSWHFQVILLR